MQETMKWSVPHFDHHGLMFGCAAFKEHVRFGFWKGALLKDPHRLLAAMGDTGMGGFKVKTLGDLPKDKVLIGYIREAAALNEQGVKVPRAKKAPKKPVVVPDDLAEALKKNKRAQATFDAFSPSHRRDYVEWITEAKQLTTRQNRVATTIQWLAEGKSRNWKYTKR